MGAALFVVQLAFETIISVDSRMWSFTQYYCFDIITHCGRNLRLPVRPVNVLLKFKF
jgi:hypothetical protein